jgi:hypothetical protein
MEEKKKYRDSFYPTWKIGEPAVSNNSDFRSKNLDSFFSRAERNCEQSISLVPKGKRVRTGGGNVGVITGRKTKEAVEILLETGEFAGQTDWISTLAKVKEI